MSTEQKVAVNFYSTIITRAIMVALTTLTSIVFYDIRGSIKENQEDTKQGFKEIRTNMTDFGNRIIRIETKIEDAKEKQLREKERENKSF